MVKKFCDFENSSLSLSISESCFDLVRVPEKNQILGSAIKYLYDFIDWCFRKPTRYYYWSKEVKYCHKIKSNCKKCNLMEDKTKCKIKEDVKFLLKNKREKNNHDEFT